MNIFKRKQKVEAETPKEEIRTIKLHVVVYEPEEINDYRLCTEVAFSLKLDIEEDDECWTITNKRLLYTHSGIEPNRYLVRAGVFPQAISQERLDALEATIPEAIEIRIQEYFKELRIKQNNENILQLNGYE